MVEAVKEQPPRLHVVGKMSDDMRLMTWQMPSNLPPGTHEITVHVLGANAAIHQRVVILPADPLETEEPK